MKSPVRFKYCVNFLLYSYDTLKNLRVLSVQRLNAWFSYSSQSFHQPVSSAVCKTGIVHDGVY